MKAILLSMALTLGASLRPVAAMAQQYGSTIIDAQLCRVDDPYGNPSGPTCADGFGMVTLTSTSGPIPFLGPIGMQLTVTSFHIMAVDPVLGPVDLYLTPGPVPPTTIISLVPNLRFPVDVELPFDAIAVIGGDVYASNAPLTFGSSNVNSIDPFRAERLQLQDDADFHGIRHCPEDVAFSLQASTTTIVLSGDDDGGGGIY